jgi:hypothetical protein
MILVVAIGVSFFPLLREKLVAKGQQYSIRRQNIMLAAKSLALCIILIWSISEINSSGFNPFIYYRF